jgi:hypothetical protein
MMLSPLSKVVLVLFLPVVGRGFSFGQNKIQTQPTLIGIGRPNTPDLFESERENDSKIPQSRRNFLLSSLLVVVAGSNLGIRPADASSGDSANLEGFDYIQWLIEKNTVADPSTFLYKGADPQVQLQRLLEASKRLNDINALVEDKKWSQVQGILTGPLGTLAETLNRIAKDSSPEVQAKAKKVKEDVFAISLAASKKNANDVAAKTSAANADIKAFVQAAFGG